MQQPTKKRCLECAGHPQKKTDPPFSYLPPDVVVDEILAHVIFRFMESMVEEEEVLLVKIKSSPEVWIFRRTREPFFCFGRFCRDGLRFPWFVFRSLYLPARLVESGKIVLCRSKMVHLEYWVPPRPPNLAYSLPRMPILQDLELRGWIGRIDPSFIHSLARPNHYPCLESLRLKIFNTRVETLILHPSNARNFRSFGYRDSCVSFSCAKTFLHSLPFVHKLTHLGPIETESIADLAQLVKPFVNLVFLEVRCGSSSVASEVLSLPFLKRLAIQPSRASREHLIGAVGYWKMPGLRVFESYGFTDYSAFFQNVRRQPKRDRFFSSLKKLVCLVRDDIIELKWPSTPTEEEIVWCSLEEVSCTRVQIRSFFTTCKFPKLKKITLQGHGDAFPAVHLPSLKYLHVERIETGFFERSECVKSLRSLVVKSRVFHVFPDSAVPLPCLESIRLSNWTGVGNLFRVLRSSSRVREVEFGWFDEGIPLTADTLDSRILKAVDLRNIAISPNFVDRKFPFLVRLTLRNCRAFASFPAVVGQFPVLKHLHLTALKFVSDSLFREPSSFPCLEFLHLDAMQMPTGTDWCAFPQLRTFHVNGCRGMGSGKVFQSGMQPRFPALEELKWRDNGELPLFEDLSCIHFPMLRMVICPEQGEAFSHMFRNHCLTKFID